MLDSEIIERYQSGRGAPSISKELNIGSTAVYRVLSRAGISPKDVWRERGWLKKFPLDVEKEIVSRYVDDGKSFKQIARLYPCSFVTVRNILRRHGVKTNPRGNKYQSFSESEINDIVEKYKNGLSQETIAGLLNTSQTKISHVLRQRGISRGASREKHGMWKGGSVSIAGYRYVSLPSEHPYRSMAHRSGYVAEHRLRMAEKLGRLLTPNETVHHINGDKLDNRPENLEVRSGRHGNGVVCRCADCGSQNIIFDEMGAEI